MFDANTVVSAALNPTGVTKRALALARAHGTLALPQLANTEAAAVLARPKFAHVIGVAKRCSC